LSQTNTTLARRPLRILQCLEDRFSLLGNGEFVPTVQMHGGAAIGGLDRSDVMRVDVKRPTLSGRDFDKTGEGSIH
jgi:hypothetical protein